MINLAPNPVVLAKPRFIAASNVKPRIGPTTKRNGHLRKVGKANIAKASGFHKNNWLQTLRYAEVAATKLKQLKDRRLDTVQLIDKALSLKYDSTQHLGRHNEAMECAKECYTLWAMNHLRNPGSIKAALALIQCCLFNDEHEDAEHYARHAMLMINEMTDNFIPADQRSQFLADGSYYLATAIFRFAYSRGIPPEEKQRVGEEAIAYARQTLQIHTQLRGNDSVAVAADMTALADASTTTTRFFVFTSERSQSIVEWKAVFLRMWLQAKGTWESSTSTEQTEQALPRIWTDARLILGRHCHI